MTEVIYNPDTLDLIVTGHAGSGKPGEDVVCAAVSTLTNTLEQVFLVQDQMEGHIMRKAGNEKNGNQPIFHAWIPKGSPLLAQGIVVMETIATGLLALSEQFPDHVSFDLRERGEEENNGEPV